MTKTPALAMVAAAVMLAACGSGSHKAQPPSSTAATSSSSAPTNRTTSRTSAAPTGSARADDWTTYYHDPARSGTAASGPSSPAKVHRLWASARLDGALYAQPLVVGNRVIVATENDTVYALDRTNGKTVWRRHLADPVSGSSLPCGDVDPVGVTSTPVIDVANERIYVAGMVMPARHELYALDLSNGKVVASTRVDAPDADPTVHNQRGALALTGGNVLVPFGGRFGDCGDYHGRVVSVATTPSGFGAVTSYTLPTKREGGFWTPPGPVVASDGSIYLASGNSSSSGPYDFGNSVVRLTSTLRLADSFAPTDWAALNSSDTDIGSTAPVLLPGNRVFQIGKGGTGYLLDAAHLGGIGGQLHSARVCSGGGAYGGVAHSGSTVFVPCTTGIAEVSVRGDSFTVGWTRPLSTPGPPIVVGNAVWAIATGDGALVALDARTGQTLTTQHLDAEPSRFVSPAAASAQVFAGANQVVFSYGD